MSDSLPFPLPPGNPHRKLTVAESAFVDTFLVHNGKSMTLIEQHAGLAPGEGGRMLADGAVRARIDQAIAERAERAQMRADQVDETLRAIATLDVADLVDDNNRLVPIRKLPPNVRMALGSLDLVVHKGEVIGVVPVPVSKLKALELIMKRLGMIDAPAKEAQPGNNTNATVININYGGEGVTPSRPTIDVTPTIRDSAAEFERMIGVG